MKEFVWKFLHAIDHQAQTTEGWWHHVCYPKISMDLELYGKAIEPVTVLAGMLKNHFKLIKMLCILPYADVTCCGRC